MAHVYFQARRSLHLSLIHIQMCIRDRQCSMPLKNIYAYRDIQEAMANDTTDQLTGEAKSIWDKLERYYSGSEDGKSVWGWERIYGPAPSSYASIDEMQSDGRIPVSYTHLTT